MVHFGRAVAQWADFPVGCAGGVWAVFCFGSSFRRVVFANYFFKFA